MLDVLEHASHMVRMGRDVRPLLMDVYGLNKPIANALANYLDEHCATTFQVPSRDRIIVEQVAAIYRPISQLLAEVGLSISLLVIFSLEVPGANTVLVNEISFDENGFMIKLSHEVEISKIPELFRE